LKYFLFIYIGFEESNFTHSTGIVLLDGAPQRLPNTVHRNCGGDHPADSHSNNRTTIHSSILETGRDSLADVFPPLQGVFFGLPGLRGMQL